MPPPSTLEAQLVRFADRIAYMNHDIDDAVRAGVLSETELPAGPMKVLAIARYGPFVMNTEREIHQAFEDYREGRMGASNVILEDNRR